MIYPADSTVKHPDPKRKLFNKTVSAAKSMGYRWILVLDTSKRGRAGGREGRREGGREGIKRPVWPDHEGTFCGPPCNQMVDLFCIVLKCLHFKSLYVNNFALAFFFIRLKFYKTSTCEQTS